MPVMIVNRPDTERVVITRGDVEITVTIYEKEPHEGHVRITTGPGSVPRTYPIRVMK